MSSTTSTRLAARPDRESPLSGTASAPLLRAAALLLGVLTLTLAGCAPAPPRLAPEGGLQKGIASWYGPNFHGRRTASGERYDMHAMTAAHPTLPFDTVVEVRNLDNGRHTQVRINDRGPFIKRRIIDLSRAAAEQIGMVPAGTARVELRTLGRVRFTEPRYTVQVAAFQDLDRAEGMAQELCSDFPAAEVRSEGAWHRVQVGRFDQREVAESLQRQLLARGLTALVVALPDLLTKP